MAVNGAGLFGLVCALNTEGVLPQNCVFLGAAGSAVCSTFEWLYDISTRVPYFSTVTSGKAGLLVLLYLLNPEDKYKLKVHIEIFARRCFQCSLLWAF